MGLVIAAFCAGVIVGVIGVVGLCLLVQAANNWNEGAP